MRAKRAEDLPSRHPDGGFSPPEDLLLCHAFTTDKQVLRSLTLASG